MKSPFLRNLAGGVGVIVLLAACSLPGVAPPEPTPLVLQPEARSDTEAPVESTGPVHQLGDSMPWVDGGTLVYIPAGAFLMGGALPEAPERTVTLGDYWIYRTEITNRMYALCVSLGYCSAPVEGPDYLEPLDPAEEHRPVVGVDWEQAEAYCAFVGGHLPTEAQWEKTARGPDGDTRPWGEAEPACELLNFDGCVGERTSVLAYPEGKSYYEVLDMAGNVFEWVQDWYQADYYAGAPEEDPLGPESGQVRSVRGSGYGTQADQVASALRFYLEPQGHRRDLGFRCVVDDPYKYAPPCEIVALVEAVPPGGPGDPLVPVPLTCDVDPPDVDLVDYCDHKIRHVHVNYGPNDADVSYSSDASCSDSPGQIACWGNGGESLEYSICTSCEPTPT